MPTATVPAPDLPSILLLDDEPRSLETMRCTLEEEFTIHSAANVAAARELLNRQAIDVILCEQRMPDMRGVAFLKEVRDAWPDCVRIAISGSLDSEDIIAGINEAGIFRYVRKPWMPEHLLEVVRSAVQARSLQHEVNRMELDLRNSPDALRARRDQRLNEARTLFDFDRIARAPGSPLDAVCDMAARLARHDLSVLVQGESGTGKELLARAIHYASPRRGGAFVAENCAAITDSRLESELFGHKRGAFTGAIDDHVGLFQRAHKGTLFLDEIGETTPSFQVKLLHVLQEGEVRPVGSARAIPVDVRIVCASHRKLEADVRSGIFREDLYYRLAEATLTMPPLRERVGNIATIAGKLLQEVSARLGRTGLKFSSEALSTLLAYPWPGNIRELRNEIGRAVALCDDPVIGARAFSHKVLNGQIGRYIQGNSDTVTALPKNWACRAWACEPSWRAWGWTGRFNKLECAVAGRPGAARAATELDAFQLLQVMMNVMENAYDAAVPVNATDPQRDITLERSATHFTLRFAYKGPGVPPENMGRIFDPFFTTKSVGRGTALGLSISYSIMERHGGQLRVENAAGGGAVFYMVLGVG